MTEIYGFKLQEKIPPIADTAIEKIFDQTILNELNSNDLESALSIIGKRVGFQLKMPEQLYGTLERQLMMIATNSGFRIQKMMLHKQNWWKKDNGPLLAVHRETGKFYALIPQSTGGYISNSQNYQKITDSNAADFEDIVYGFFLPFPDHVIRIWDVIKLTLGSTKYELYSLFFTQIIIGLLGILVPILFGSIIDAAIPLSSRSLLNQIILGLIVATLCSVILSILQSIAFLRIKIKSNNFMESALWERLLRIDLSFFRKYGVGEIIDRINGINIINSTISASFLKLLLSGTWAFFSIASIFYYESTLGWFLIFTTLIMSLFLFMSSLTQLYFNKRLQNIEGRSTNLLIQMISGIKKIRTTHSENIFYKRWIDLLTAQLTYTLKANTILIMVKSIQSFTMIILILIIYNHIVTLMIEQTPLELGVFITINGLIGMYTTSFLTLTSTLLSYLHLIPTYERITPIFEAIPESRLNEYKVHPYNDISEISLENVSFSYENTTFQTIQNVSLKINKGDFVAFVGSSGSGKSTLLRLILGLESPQEGKILFDGIDIKQMPIQWLRSQFGIVLQTTNLINGTLFDNVTGFDNTRTIEDVHEALRLVNLEEELKKFPMGLETIVMNNGAGLSLGQRQRILIARALCRKAKILILDEATSALDSLNQSIIHENINKLNLTRIVVAHRLTTIQLADTIHVFNKGIHMESGTYNELTKKDSHFNKIMF